MNVKQKLRLQTTDEMAERKFTDYKTTPALSFLHQKGEEKLTFVFIQSQFFL